MALRAGKHTSLETRFSEDTSAKRGLKTCFTVDISHLFDILKSAAQSEIKAYFVHASSHNNSRQVGWRQEVTEIASPPKADRNDKNREAISK
jgi:hypothetical protein